MEIDLTQLDDLFKADLSHDKGVRRPINQLSNKNVAQGKIEGLNDIKSKDKPKQYLMIEKEKGAHENAARVYREYQDNTIKSGMLKSEILKGIQLGQDPYNLLLKAIECISLMTGNPHYYKQAKDDLQAIYGALGYKAPAEQEVQEVQERLNNLIKALEQEPDQRSKERINRAIQAHKERKEYLLKLIS